MIINALREWLFVCIFFKQKEERRKVVMYGVGRGGGLDCLRVHVMRYLYSKSEYYMANIIIVASAEDGGQVNFVTVVYLRIYVYACQ